MPFLPELVGESPAIGAVREEVRHLLELDSGARRVPPILLQGETGTGKGALAAAIWRASRRSGARFVHVNCAAIPETLLEAELFGFERGAFTDARQAKPGLFHEASGGGIFLDEVALLPMALQAKLLTVIEEGTVRRLGRTRPEPVDVWIFSATSDDLATAIRERRFREELYHRLAVLTLSLPPLRARGADVLLLAEHFLAKACADYRLPPRRLSPDARHALAAHPWPGNVRELANVMERVALLSTDPVVTRESLGLPEAHADRPRKVAGRAGSSAHGSVDAGREGAGEAETARLEHALREAGWNVSRAASLLGVTRNTLRYRIEKHGLRSAAGAGGSAPVAGLRAPGAGPTPPRCPPAPPVASPPCSWEEARLSVLLVEAASEDRVVDGGRALGVVGEKVESFGGRVLEMQRSGATVLAAFGIEPIEDSPVRAALAAMAIRKALHDERTADVRAALHVGRFLLGRVGLASGVDHDAKQGAWASLTEILGGAPPGAILASPTARPFLARRFRLAATTDGLWRLVGREEAALAFARAPLVGRRRELELLEERLDSARAGRGQVVAISGEPGIGKSRLLFEFRQLLRSRPERLTYREARCDSHARGLPFAPAVQVLRANCGLSESDSPDVIASKVGRSLRALGLKAEEAGPYLLRLLGISEGTERLADVAPEAIHARTFEILWQIALLGSRRRPVVLTVEDVHWIDRASEEYLAPLARSVAGSSILLVVTHRTGYRPAWLDGLDTSRGVDVILERLDESDGLRMVRGVPGAEGIPERVARAIVAKAEGNPFFIEELARAVAERSGPEAAPVPADAIPDTIQMALQARIDLLPEGPRRVLRTASILGRAFSVRLLAALCPDRGALTEHLAELTRLGFLEEPGASDDPDRAFKHALTHEVAHAGIPLAERTALHGAAGSALEGLFAGRLEEARGPLAYHYSRSERADKAVEHLLLLSEKAARAYALTEAVAALDDAAPHVEQLPTEERGRRRIDVSLRRARSLCLLGRPQDGLDDLLRCEGDVDRLGDAVLSGRFHFLLANAYRLLGDQARASDNARRALEESSRGLDEATLGKAHYHLSLGCVWAGEFREGLVHGRRAIALLGRSDRPRWVGLGHWIVGVHHYLMGQFDAALSAEEQALALGEASGDPLLTSYAHWGTGIALAARGEREEGLAACRRALDAAPDPLSRAVALSHLGYAHFEAAQPAEALPLLEAAAEQLGRFRYQHQLAWATIWTSEALLALGDVPAARERALRALEIAVETGSGFALGLARGALGRVLLALGAAEEAEPHLAWSLDRLTAIGARFEAERARRALAGLAPARGASEPSTK